MCNCKLGKFSKIKRTNKEFKLKLINTSEIASQNSQISHNSSLSKFEIMVEDVEDDFIFVGEAFNIPKSTASPSEDAYFTASKGVGVSDGVGSWCQFGIACHKFSNSLMKNCHDLIS